MSLNIKNEEAHTLATRVAQLTGENLTQAVTTSLRERLARIEQPDALAEELLEIGRDCAAAPGLAGRRSWSVALRRKGSAAMIVDTSALIALLRNEADAPQFARALASQAESKRVSAANFLEAAIVIDGARDPIASRRLDN